MTRKFRRAIPLVLALVMILSLTAYAADNRLQTYVDELPTVSAVGVASMKLSTLELKGGKAVNLWGRRIPGKFVWGNGDQIMEPGIHEMTVVFQPYDTKNYAPCSFCVKVHAYKLNLTVKKIPTVEEKLAVGEAVGSLTLVDGIAVNHFDKLHPPIDGHFEFVDSEQKYDEPGTYECPVVFKPENSDLYNDSTVTYIRNPDMTFKNAFVRIVVE